MEIPRISREQARALDRAALEEFGLPGLVLMEHAGRSAAELVRDLPRAGNAPEPVTIFCAGGNNGGDGFVIARFLDTFGFDVECVCCAPLDTAHGDARIERQSARDAGIRFHHATHSAELATQRERILGDARPRIFVDALLGTGFQGEVKPHIARVIRVINELRAQPGAIVVAVDVPSGLDCDTGVPADPTVRADVTATFVAEKIGFETAGARAVLGRVVVLPIGIPRLLLERVLARRAVDEDH